MPKASESVPSDWSEWKRTYQNVIRHSKFEWDFAIDVIPAIVGLKPSQVIPQHPFIGRDGREYHMDFAIVTDHVKVAIELEGFDKTGSGVGKSKREHDEFNKRIQHLTRLGWKVFPITNAQFMNDKLGYAREIAQLLAQAESTNRGISESHQVREVRRIPRTAILVGLGIAVALLLFVAFRLDESQKPQYFRRCADLQEVYPQGIAQSQEAKERKIGSNATVNKTVYEANRHLDKNYSGPDGLICDW